MVERFREFAARKLAAANAARMLPFHTVEDRSQRFVLDTIAAPFALSLFDGPFFESPVEEGALPTCHLVFVQSRDGNTEAEDPSELGGGETDKHLIYEGLTRVHADAVLAGARTVGDGGLIFSVWHPELVALRLASGRPRHPLQAVASASGHLPIEDGLLFNAPAIAVVILTTDAGARHLEPLARARPWISIISSGAEANADASAERLRREFGVRRISAVGGRTLATQLIEAGLVRDLYLTTSPIEAGIPNTPLYERASRLVRDLVVRKQDATGVIFEHWRVDCGPEARGQRPKARGGRLEVGDVRPSGLAHAELRAPKARTPSNL